MNPKNKEQNIIYKMIKLFYDFLYEFTLTQNPIANVEKYIEGMNKGTKDKLFFFNNGTLLNE